MEEKETNALEMATQTHQAREEKKKSQTVRFININLKNKISHAKKIT